MIIVVVDRFLNVRTNITNSFSIVINISVGFHVRSIRWGDFVVVRNILFMLRAFLVSRPEFVQDSFSPIRHSIDSEVLAEVDLICSWRIELVRLPRNRVARVLLSNSKHKPSVLVSYGWRLADVNFFAGSLTEFVTVLLLSIFGPIRAIGLTECRRRSAFEIFYRAGPVFPALSFNFSTGLFIVDVC